MRRRSFVLAVGAAMLPGAGLGQRVPSSARRVGILVLTKKGDAAMVDALSSALAAAGFKAGEVALDVASIEFDLARADAVARSLVAAKPDVLYATYEPIVDALKAHAQRIPIVFVYVTEPVQRGYVQSLSQPGGNITGVTDRYVETGVKRLELLRELAPRARRVGFVAYFDDPLGLDVWRQAASQLRFAVSDIDLEKAPSMDAALAAGVAGGVDAFFPIGSLRRSRAGGDANGVAAFMRFAQRQRVPVVYSTSELVTTRGGLASIEVDVAQVVGSGAQMVIRVLRGQSPATMAVVQPDRFSIVVNAATAKSIGLIVPPTVLARADRVVE
jgi:putative ABC transport system substrate-binding protein